MPNDSTRLVPETEESLDQITVDSARETNLQDSKETKEVRLIILNPKLNYNIS